MGLPAQLRQGMRLLHIPTHDQVISSITQEVSLQTTYLICVLSHLVHPECNVSANQLCLFPFLGHRSVIRPMCSGELVQQPHEYVMRSGRVCKLLELKSHGQEIGMKLQQPLPIALHMSIIGKENPHLSVDLCARLSRRRRSCVRSLLSRTALHASQNCLTSARTTNLVQECYSSDIRVGLCMKWNRSMSDFWCVT